MGIDIGGSSYGPGVAYMNQQQLLRELQFHYAQLNGTLAQQANESQNKSLEAAGANKASVDRTRLELAAQQQQHTNQLEQANRFHGDQMSHEQAALAQQQQLREDAITARNQQIQDQIRGRADVATQNNTAHLQRIQEIGANKSAQHDLQMEAQKEAQKEKRREHASMAFADATKLGLEGNEADEYVKDRIGAFDRITGGGSSNEDDETPPIPASDTTVTPTTNFDPDSGPSSASEKLSTPSFSGMNAAPDAPAPDAPAPDDFWGNTATAQQTTYPPVVPDEKTPNFNDQVQDAQDLTARPHAEPMAFTRDQMADRATQANDDTPSPDEGPAGYGPLPGTSTRNPLNGLKDEDPTPSGPDIPDSPTAAAFFATRKPVTFNKQSQMWDDSSNSLPPVPYSLDPKDATPDELNQVGMDQTNNPGVSDYQNQRLIALRRGMPDGGEMAMYTRPDLGSPSRGGHAVFGSDATLYTPGGSTQQGQYNSYVQGKNESVLPWNNGYVEPPTEPEPTPPADGDMSALRKYQNYRLMGQPMLDAADVGGSPQMSPKELAKPTAQPDTQDDLQYTPVPEVAPPPVPEPPRDDNPFRAASEERSFTPATAADDQSGTRKPQTGYQATLAARRQAMQDSKSEQAQRLRQNADSEMRHRDAQDADTQDRLALQRDAAENKKNPHKALTSRIQQEIQMENMSPAQAQQYIQFEIAQAKARPMPGNPYYDADEAKYEPKKDLTGQITSSPRAEWIQAHKLEKDDTKVMALNTLLQTMRSGTQQPPARQAQPTTTPPARGAAPVSRQAISPDLINARIQKYIAAGWKPDQAAQKVHAEVGQ